MNWCRYSNPTQYERNRWVRSLVHAISWQGSVAMLPSVWLWLNASKSESMLERDVRQSPMETIIPLPTELLLPVQCREGCSIHQTATGTNPLQTTYMERGIVRTRVSLSYDLLRSILLPSICHPLFFFLCWGIWNVFVYVFIFIFCVWYLFKVYFDLI